MVLAVTAGALDVDHSRAPAVTTPVPSSGGVTF
jgi:hypothetical protein